MSGITGNRAASIAEIEWRHASAMVLMISCAIANRDFVDMPFYNEIGCVFLCHDKLRSACGDGGITRLIRANMIIKYIVTRRAQAHFINSLIDYFISYITYFGTPLLAVAKRRAIFPSIGTAGKLEMSLSSDNCISGGAFAVRLMGLRMTIWAHV